MRVADIFTTGTRVTGHDDHDDWRRHQHGGHHRGHWQNRWHGWGQGWRRDWCWDD